MFAVLAIVVLFVLVAALGELVRRSRARIARLERSQTIDPATLLGTPFALERELTNAVKLPWDLSIAEIQFADARNSRDAANALRAICAHGVDQIFCLDLAAGSFVVIIYGKLDPDNVADYFVSELDLRDFPAKIGWAYCRSADPAIRQGVRAAAQAALLRVKGHTGHTGVEVALVEPGQWPADDLRELVIGPSLKTRREELCLTRKEFAKILKLSEAALRDIEVGRAQPAHQAKFILSVAEILQQSVARVQRLTDAVAGAAARELQSPPPAAGGDSSVQGADNDRAGAIQRAIELQRSILATRSAGRSKGAVPPSSSSSAAADQAMEPGGEHSAMGEVTGVGKGGSDAAK